MGVYLRFYDTRMKAVVEMKWITDIKMSDRISREVNALHGSSIYGFFKTDSYVAKIFVDFFKQHAAWKTAKEYITIFGDDNLMQEKDKKAYLVEERVYYRRLLALLRKAMRTHKYLVFSIG